MGQFAFATGIENSYPVIADGVRVDEMDKCGHYRRWREDLQLVRELGLTHLRWGPALYRTFTAPGCYDWSWTDDVLAEARSLGIEPMLDLCHFGVPDWLGNFQNPDFAPYFAEYAGAFARRYPHVRHWMPINEPLVTTLFSARHGWWNERLATDEAFVRATLNVCRASRLAMAAIRSAVPDAVFVQSESCEYTHPAEPESLAQASFRNERRFVALDLIYGRRLHADIHRYLELNGMTAADHAYFMTPLEGFNCILGTDYYGTNEHLLRPDGGAEPAGDVLGYSAIARQYAERYHLPLMATETNRWDNDGAVQWLRKQWLGLLRLVQEGVPVTGFTWYSLTDQMDWDTALREDRRRVNAVGLFDLDRRIRPVGRQYRRLVREWKQAPILQKCAMLGVPGERSAA